MEKYQYIPLENILAKYHRDFRGLDIPESDAIEWIGEALGFMKIPSVAEEAIAYAEVVANHVSIPKNIHNIIQIAKNNDWTLANCETCTPSTIIDAYSSLTDEEQTTAAETCGTYIPVDQHGIPIGTEEQRYYMPYFDLQGEYYAWRNCNTYRQGWSPVVLSNHVFFESLVCRPDDLDNAVYENSNDYDEYTIAGDKIRFSFESGFVAIAYLRQRVDLNTGYPLIPDNEYARNAITYYMAWKMNQRACYSHREGACQLADRAEIQWRGYIKKFKNNAKMPTGIDQHQNLMQQSRYMIPRLNRYYGFFGKLGRPEKRPFNHPRRN